MRTLHASAGRATLEQIRTDHQELSKLPYLNELIQALPYVTTILNPDRQIVFSNRKLFEILGISNIEEILGKRPGEVLNCIRSDEMEAGCGTSAYCQVCGAVNSIIRCQETGKPVTDECRIRISRNGSEDCLDLEVTASLLPWDSRAYIIFTLRDISIEKRKEALERIFFHDVINTAGTLQGLADVLKQLQDPGKISQFITMLGNITRNLTEEILNQKSLLAAEKGQLSVKKHAFYLQETMKAIVKEFRGHDLALNKKIGFMDRSCRITLFTDPVLLRRVLSNMIKNALEATHEDDEIKIGCDLLEDHIIIHVHNPAFIPEDVQKQIFQRSFSTKGRGRGLGTYSMKLITEKYLNGKIYFTSSKEEGTKFSLRLPVSSQADFQE